MDLRRSDYEAARDDAMAALQAAHLTGDELRTLLGAATVVVPEPVARTLAAVGVGSVQAVDWQRMCDLLALRRRQREGE